MPDIKVIYWNIEDFGDVSARRGNYVPLCGFIAEVARNVDADIICIMEVTRFADLRLDLLLRSLLNAYNIVGIGQTCDWYYDWVPGTIRGAQNYDPNRAGFTNQARNEGYAVFWKQNIDKFIVQRADPIDLAIVPPGRAAGAGNVANTQSYGVVARAAGPPAVLLADIAIPAGTPQYILPMHSTVGGGGIMRAGVMVVNPGVPAGPTNLDAGDVVSAGTIIGGEGVTLSVQTQGVDPIVIPGSYTLPGNLILPAANETIVPQHVLSLVLSCRELAGGVLNAYNPGGVNNWELGSFPATNGALLWNGSRRPAFLTIKTTTHPDYRLSCPCNSARTRQGYAPLRALSAIVRSMGFRSARAAIHSQQPGNRGRRFQQTA
jgi:hypothetical protein